VQQRAQNGEEHQMSTSERPFDTESTRPDERRGEFVSARLLAAAVLVLLVVVGGIFVVIGSVV
jgi:hypothetical protein